MGRRTQSIVSMLLMASSVVLLAVVAALYFRDGNGAGEPVPRTPIPGHNEAIHVLDALQDQGLDAEFGGQGTGVRSQALEGTAHLVRLDSGRAYVFIYRDVPTQRDAALDVLPEDVDLVDVSGDPVEYDDIELFTGSNVAVVLVNSDEETAQRVSEAVQALP